MDRNTILFNSSDKHEQKTTEEVLKTVYSALEEKGYNAIDQMVGYILSGDSSYITSRLFALGVQTTTASGYISITKGMEPA